MGFFDNLGRKASETYKQTTDKTSKIAKEMKLKSYINENKNKINKIYTEIGKKVYEKHVEGDVSGIEEFIKPELDQIAETAKRIEEMNNEIRTIKDLRLCKKCAAEISINAKFCPQCGAVQEPGKDETIEKVEVVEKVPEQDTEAVEATESTDNVEETESSENMESTETKAKKENE